MSVSVSLMSFDVSSRPQASCMANTLGQRRRVRWGTWGEGCGAQGAKDSCACVRACVCFEGWYACVRARDEDAEEKGIAAFYCVLNPA